MRGVLGFISSYQVLDFIPLDLLLHFIVGLAITIGGLKFKLPFYITFLLLLIVAAGKEFNDYFFHYPAGWKEYTSDFLVTMLYASILFFVRKSISKEKHKNKKQESKKIKIY